MRFGINENFGRGDSNPVGDSISSLEQRKLTAAVIGPCPLAKGGNVKKKDKDTTQDQIIAIRETLRSLIVWMSGSSVAPINHAEAVQLIKWLDGEEAA